MMNANGSERSHPALSSVAADSGSIMMSARSFVANIDSTSVDPTSAATADRQVAKRATMRRAACSNRPMPRSAPTTARMPNRQASVFTSK